MAQQQPVTHQMSVMGEMTLRLDTNTNHSNCCCYMNLEGDPFSLDELKQFVKERVVDKYYRFRCTADVKTGLFTEVKVNIDNHVKELKVGEKATEEMVAERISQLMGDQLNYAFPLWELYLVSYNQNNQSLFLRTHHCIGDGMSVGAMLSHIGDKYAKENSTDSKEEKPSSAPSSSLNKTKKKKSLLQKTMQAIVFILWLLFGSIFVLIRWLYMAATYPPIPTLFKQAKIGESKRVAWTMNKKDMRLDDVKNFGRSVSKRVTFNDTMLALLMESLYKYVQQEDIVDKHSAIGIAIPVNIRSSLNIKKLGNKVGSWSLIANVESSSLTSRIKAIHSTTKFVKMIPEQYIAFGICKIAAKLPSWVSQPLFDAMLDQVYCIITNVRGPEEPFYYYGRKVTTMMAFVPPPPTVMLGIAIASYNDKVFVSINSDASLIPQPQRVIDIFQQLYSDNIEK